LLRFGPEWPESDERLAFDACSGDYWVLDALGRQVMQRLLDGGAQSTAQLKATCASGLRGAGGADELDPALAQLLEAGLIEPAPASAP
jgi:PqqD family protein of HPr-rel-A system